MIVVLQAPPFTNVVPAILAATVIIDVARFCFAGTIGGRGTCSFCNRCRLLIRRRFGNRRWCRNNNTHAPGWVSAAASETMAAMEVFLAALAFAAIFSR